MPRTETVKIPNDAYIARRDPRLSVGITYWSSSRSASLARCDSSKNASASASSSACSRDAASVLPAGAKPLTALDSRLGRDPRPTPSGYEELLRSQTSALPASAAVRGEALWLRGLRLRRLAGLRS